MRWLMHLSYVTIFLRDFAVARPGDGRYRRCNAPVAQLDRGLPSEGVWLSL